MPAAAIWTGRAEAQVEPIETPSHDHARTRHSGAQAGHGRAPDRPPPPAQARDPIHGLILTRAGKNSRKRPPSRAGNSQPLRHFCQVKNSFRTSVSRGSFAAAVAAALSLAIAVPAQATTDTLDQSQTLTMSFQRQISFLAQTFTAGMSGQLDRVSLAPDSTTGFASIRVSIQTVTSGGTPTGTTLGSATAFAAAFTCCRQFHDFAFNPTVSITSGTSYAIVVQTVGGVFTWYNSSTLDAYTGGRLYVGSTWLTGSQWGEDFAFKTWVAASTNSAPSVAATTAAVSANEGTAPTVTGTF